MLDMNLDGFSGGLCAIVGSLSIDPKFPSIVEELSKRALCVLDGGMSRYYLVFGSQISVFPFVHHQNPSTGGGKHRYQLPELKPAIEVDKNNYISRSWLSRTKPKAVVRQEIVVDDHDQHSGGEKVVGGDIKGGRGGVIEGRKSVSHVESNLASVVAFLQVKVLVSDMPSSMQVHAFRCARRTYDSLEKFSAKHMAYNIKKKCVLLAWLSILHAHA
ncbi:hypothetical protein TIFTF001_029973 [Ficus carica]|uniref:Dynein light chain n=1 Tax=Ficus carica TaxID=3494 RepID=A0AA88DSZ7_FICCA|nr:hypothetical protein TIFTF001_029973 [Ficus carica]